MDDSVVEGDGPGPDSDAQALQEASCPFPPHMVLDPPATAVMPTNISIVVRVTLATRTPATKATALTAVTLMLS